VHVDDEQAGTALPGFGQALPQVPQFDALFVVFTSQPLAGLLSQFAKPALHDTLHMPATHAPLAFGFPPQTVPQTPQFAASVLRFTSQPFAATLSQSAKPARQVKPHAPLVQVRTELAGVGQLLAHAPQLFTSAEVGISQPSP
jgi:hypothetical protein